MTSEVPTEVIQQFHALCQRQDFKSALPLARHLRPMLIRDRRLANTWGWVLYRQLKNLQQRLQQKDGRAANNLPEHLAQQVREILVEYARLPNLHRPDLLHALMLATVCRIGTRWRGILGFLYYVRAFDTLRPEDRRPRTLQQRTYPSLEQQLTRTVAAALAKLPLEDQRPEVLNWASTQVQQRLSRFPDKPWIPYHLACYLIKKQRISEARPLLAPVLLQHHQKSWIWEKVARANQDRPAHRLTALTQALRLATKEHPVVRFRLHLYLAELLAAEQRYDEAAAQLQAARRLEKELGRNEQDRRNPLWRSYRQMLQQPWFRQRAERTDLPQEPALTIQPDVILYEHQPLQEAFGVVIHHNPDRNRTLIRLSPSEVVSVKHRRFPQASRLEPGTVVWLCLAEKRVVALEPRAGHPLPDLVRRFRGRLLQPEGRAFAFVLTEDNERIFIAPGLNRQLALEAGAMVEVLAERTIDPKKKMLSWSALKVEPVADR
ncbi:DUF7017 domain-containing protein [Rhodothermus marinus]|uniref:TOTE conflict systems S1/CSD-like domain-containing protein n=1 Tax=Rhodothermus marinus (strain ATCC 43812 / DSM 4252 / R-10) TaxID=518766 RepID=D0MKQ3_RHOM4|nr:hypothetical protein [Rhodothermus marinus]ACY49717.1 hypothetical protein Rmar_2850 [Rhodothermus marinus DSM 4252]